MSPLRELCGAGWLIDADAITVSSFRFIERRVRSGEQRLEGENVARLAPFRKADAQGGGLFEVRDGAGEID